MTRPEDLWKLSRRELWERLRAGHPIDPAALDNSVFRGVSLGLPGFVDKLLWKTFQKTFHLDPHTGRRRGWNVKLQQTGFGFPSQPKRKKDGEPLTFGHYAVVGMEGSRAPGGLEKGLLLDYGQGGNARLDPTGFLRDPIVAVEEGNFDLLLGWSYVAIGGLRFGTPSFFTLEREKPLDHHASPPRG